MAQIEQFRPKSREDNNFNRDIKRHRKIKRYGIIGTLLVAFLVVVIIIVNNKTKVYSKYEVDKDIAWSVSADAQCIRFQGDILVYSADGAHCTNVKGKELWNITYQMQSPMVVTNGKYAAIADYNGTIIYIMNKDGKQGEINTNIPIKKIVVSKNGYVAAILDNGSATPIYLYDTAGNEQAYARITMEDTGYPMDMAISDNGKLLAVYYLKVDKDLKHPAYKSCINFYNFGEVGGNLYDNFISGYDYTDEIFGSLHYAGNDTVFALSGSHLYVFKGAQKPILSETVEFTEEIKSAFYESNLMGVVFSDDRTSDGYILNIYDINGKKKGNVHFSVDYTDITYRNNRAFIYNSSECFIYTFDGKKKFEGNFTDKVTLVLTSDRLAKYFLVSKDKIKTVEFK